MTSRKRSKAIKRVTKLLNLATSNVDHEADLALNHAHNVIYNHNIQPEEIDSDKLCDKTVLAQVDWHGDWTERPEVLEEWELDDELESVEAPTRPVVIREINTWQQRQQAGFTVEADPDEVEVQTLVEDQAEEISAGESEPTPEPEQAVNTDESGFDSVPPDFEQIVESGAFMVFERDPSPPARCDDPDDESSSSDSQMLAVMTSTELVEAEPKTDSSSASCAEEVEPDHEQDEDGETFDENEARAHLAEVIDQIIEAKNLYTAYRDEREQGDIDEEEEKAVRVAAEIAAEEAAERAFRERAEDQLRWEAEMSKLRQERRYREQNALKRLRSLRDEHEDLKKRLAAHESWKQEQIRLALLDEISNQLQIAADHIAEATNPAFDMALLLMDENDLRLQDLPLARIHHKSIFMRLLEREARNLETASEKESFTQAMLKEYLAVYHPPTVDLAGKVLELLKVASSGSESAEDAFREAREILEKNSMSIRDLDIGQIDQISLFVRLLNWEADKLRDMDAREHFTAKMLDRYFEAVAAS